MTQGDLIIYRGSSRVTGRITRILEDTRSVGIELDRAVETLVRVKIGETVVDEIDVLGARNLRIALPEATVQLYGSVLACVQQLPLSVEAQAHPLDPRNAGLRSAMSFGLGVDIVMDASVLEALQRAIRFLMMDPDPLDANRGGGLRQLHRIQGLTQAQGHQLVQLACERYARYAHRKVGSTWVSRVAPRRFVRQDAAQTSGDLAVGSLATEPSWWVELHHTLETPTGTLEVPTSSRLGA